MVTLSHNAEFQECHEVQNLTNKQLRIHPEFKIWVAGASHKVQIIEELGLCTSVKCLLYLGDLGSWPVYSKPGVSGVGTLDSPLAKVPTPHLDLREVPTLAGGGVPTLAGGGSTYLGVPLHVWT